MTFRTVPWLSFTSSAKAPLVARAIASENCRAKRKFGLAAVPARTETWVVVSLVAVCLVAGAWFGALLAASARPSASDRTIAHAKIQALAARMRLRITPLHP